jgi:hypothetical protein
MRFTLQIVVFVLTTILLITSSSTVNADERARIPEPSIPSTVGPRVGRVVRERAEGIKVTGSFAFTQSQNESNMREGAMTKAIQEWLKEVLEEFTGK